MRPLLLVPLCVHMPHTRCAGGTRRLRRAADEPKCMGGCASDGADISSVACAQVLDNPARRPDAFVPLHASSACFPLYMSQDIMRHIHAKAAGVSP